MNSFYYKAICTFFLMVLFTFQILAQGKIAGKVIDKATGEPVIGATVTVKDANAGAASDLDGNYFISVSPGSYTLLVEYLGYTTSQLAVTVTDKETTHLDIAMIEGAEQLEEVVVQGELRKETVDALLIQQKNAVANVSGISAEQFRKLPDRTTGDILKRVSGASIQEGKFAVIRGLSDRYNMALINGLPMPSTESDRKAFSFDLIPAVLLDNMIIVKTATPDVPGDFAGGLIQINTRDIPDENLQTLNIGVGTHSLTTFKSTQREGGGGSSNFLGIAKGTSSIPDGAANADVYNNLDTKSQAKISQQFNNNYTASKINSTRPNFVIQYTLGKRINVIKNPLGIIFALNYNNNMRYTQTEINQYSSPGLSKEGTFVPAGDLYRSNILAGGILNFAYRIGQNTKLSFKNLYNINADSYVASRSGSSLGPSPTESYYFRDLAFYLNSNKMYSNQLSAEHVFVNKIKLKAIAGLNSINRTVPDYKKITYVSSYNEDENGSGYYSPYYLGFSPTITNFADGSGKYFSNLKEKSFNGAFDITLPFNLFFKNEFKIGYFHQDRNRDFNYRSFSYTSSQSNLNFLSSEVAFSDVNFQKGTIYLPESGNSFYKATSSLNAFYAMMDNRFNEKLRLIWGGRLENYNQLVNTANLGDLQSKFGNKDFLPSATFIYGINKVMNFKVSFAKTLSRPEFREVSPVIFYDFNLNSVISGNSSLSRALIFNYDLKYEFYPSAGETFSITPFFKQFNNPIESIWIISSTRQYSYTNQRSAQCYGIEFEARKKFLRNFVIFANYSLINSKVQTVDSQDQNEGRPLQGQSPYVVNAGLQFLSEEHQFNVSLSFNRIGRRIAYINPYKKFVIWENPRAIIDFQISKTFFKKLEVRYVLGDILAQSQIFYNDLDDNGKYSVDKDVRIYSYKMGFINNFSIGYKF